MIEDTLATIILVCGVGLIIASFLLTTLVVYWLTRE